MNGTDTRKPTTPQFDLIRTLLMEIGELDADAANTWRAELNLVRDRHQFDFDAARQAIKDLINAKRALTRKVGSAQPVQKNSVPEIPEGRYAITGTDGTTDFYRVAIKEDGRYKLFLYVSDAQPEVKSWAHVLRVLRAIEKDGPGAASLRWALEMVRCRDCGAKLTDEGNPYRDQGYGPECGKKH